MPLDRHIIGRNQWRGAALLVRKSLGGSPLTPRIADWRRDPGFRLGVFFYLFRHADACRPAPCRWLPLSDLRYNYSFGHPALSQSGALPCPPPAGSFLAFLSSSCSGRSVSTTAWSRCGKGPTRHLPILTFSSSSGTTSFPTS